MNDTQSTVVRLSLRWVVAAVFVVLALGVIGGMIGVNFSGPRTPLTLPGDQLVTTVQEVTISPSRVTTELVRQHERSVLLLAHGSRTNPSLLGTATVVTNDGVLAAYHEPVSGEVFAIDTAGSYISLESLGRDSLYDIAFYRAQSGVLAPIELGADDPGVGASLLLLERSTETNTPVARPLGVEQYVLAGETDPLGWQRFGILTPEHPTQLGSPLLTDEGKLAGISTRQTGGQLLPVSHVRSSLDRLAASQRELDPFDELGLTVRRQVAEPDDGRAFAVEHVVTSVDRALAGSMRVRDVITAVNGEDISSETNIVSTLSQTPPLTITTRRGSQIQTITIPPASPTP